MKKALVILLAILPGFLLAQGINKVQYSVNGDIKSSIYGSDAGNYTFTHYHSSGIKSSTGKFKNGVKHGTWKTWDENGKITAVAHYRKGEKTGKWVISESDKTTFEISFNKNHMVHALKKDVHGNIVAKR